MQNAKFKMLNAGGPTANPKQETGNSKLVRPLATPLRHLGPRRGVKIQVAPPRPFTADSISFSLAISSAKAGAASKIISRILA